MITTKDITPEIIKYIKTYIHKSQSTTSGFKIIDSLYISTEYDYIKLLKNASTIRICKLVNTDSVLTMETNNCSFSSFIGNYSVGSGNNIGVYENTIGVKIQELSSEEVQELFFSILLHDDYDKFKGSTEFVQNCLELYAFIWENTK